MADVTILTMAELRQAVRLDDALVDAIEAALRPAAGAAPARFARRLDPGGPRPAASDDGGLIVLFDGKTRATETLLLDQGYLSALRGAAAGALAARHLARAGARVGGILGTGRRALTQSLALAHATEIERLLVWGRSPDRLGEVVEAMAQATGLAVEAVETAEQVVRAADVLVTATASHQPLVRAEWLRPGMHITVVGIDDPDKNELAPEVMAEVDLYVSDSAQRCRWIGELNHAIGAGLVNEKDPVVELGDVIAGTAGGRGGDDDITVADLTGTGEQDTAIAVHAAERAKALGLGRIVAND
jgi:ornithine cyclodeaminase/alanine dehydrogenase-like protein (mu-crystallin family)